MTARHPLSFIMERRTVRHYLDKPVPQELVDAVLEAAINAPSAHNSQPWVFFLIKEPTVRERLVKDMVDEWERVMRNDGRPEELIATTKHKFCSRFMRAPVLILACVNHDSLYYERYSDDHRKTLEGILGHHSLAAALENMLLAASIMGLGACWYSAPLFCADIVRRTLKIGTRLEPAALVTMGYPAKRERRQKPLKPLGEVVIKI
jgi:F420 biosynthesis protein FbiB-like protein